MAIVFLPFTLAAMLLFWVCCGLWLSFWQAVGTTLEAAWRCWPVEPLFLLGWALVWGIADHSYSTGMIDAGWKILIYWPWLLGRHLLAALHLPGATGWWDGTYLHIGHLYNTQQLDLWPLLTPAAAYLLLLGIIFLVVSWLPSPSVAACHRTGRSRRLAILMVQAAQHGDRDDGTRRACSWCRFRDSGDGLPDPLMWPRRVEVRHVCPQHAPQVPLAQDEDVIEAFTAHTPEEPLAGGVGARGADGRAQHPDSARGGELVEPRPVLAIV
ncbi:MAG TPA: hypothetical protein VFL91_31165, partial [Thermomicrobiales bacterium]|nr:hypothetical protein [Thermomicrobiales bacterium]